MTGREQTATWLVSACLLGRACRYDGRSKAHPGVSGLAMRIRHGGGTIVSVCPEELGGLATPRPAAELRGGDGHAVLAGTASVRRLDRDEDVTSAFVAGAEAALALAPEATHAVLKARSPSCGCGAANQDGHPRPGDGVFAALLRQRGLSLRTEEEVETGAREE